MWCPISGRETAEMRTALSWVSAQFEIGGRGRAPGQNHLGCPKHAMALIPSLRPAEEIVHGLPDQPAGRTGTAGNLHSHAMSAPER